MERLLKSKMMTDTYGAIQATGLDAALQQSSTSNTNWWPGNITQTVPITNATWGHTAVTFTDPVEDLISQLFTAEDKAEWLIQNGFESNDFAEFNRHVKEKLKKMLLAPKLKINVKLPE
jgi:hypothetical protein